MSEIIDCISYVVRKTFWSFWVCIKFLFLRFLDLIGLIFNVLACCTIWKLPPMIKQFQDMDSLSEWRYVGFVQCLICLMDLVVFVAGCIVCLTIWRVYPLWKDLKHNDVKFDTQVKDGQIYFSGYKPRRIVLKHFFWLFVDLIFIPAALLCLFSWRCKIFIHKIRKAPTDWKRRLACFKQLGQLMIDIPCLLVGLFVVLTWRLPFLVREVRNMPPQERKWNNDRFLVFRQLGLFLLDVPCMLACLFVMVTWRCPFLLQKLSRVNVWRDESKVRRIIVEQMVLLIPDIPCWLCVVIVIVTMWRLPFFCKRVKKSLKLKSEIQSSLRVVAVEEAGLVFIDFGCFLMAVVVVGTVWRLYPMVSAINRYCKQWYTSVPGQEEAADHPQSGRRSSPPDVMHDESHEVAGAAALAINPSENVSSINAMAGVIQEDEINVELNTNKSENIEDEADMEESVSAASRRSDGESEEVSDKKDTGPGSGLQKDANSEPVTMTDDVVTSEPVRHDISHNTSTVTSRPKFGWKIRRAIAKNFLFIFIDLPAIPLFFFILVTVLRFPKLLSALLQSGDFYMEFALFVYYQVFKLLVDLVFLIIFLFLVLVRPVAAWVHVFEDEEHMKYRLIAHYMQWIPDIIDKRQHLYENLECLFCIELKRLSSPLVVRSAMTRVIKEYTEELEWVRCKLRDLELDQNVMNYIQSVIWWESKRPILLQRRYQSEYVFIQRPDVAMHKENLFRFRREFMDYENAVTKEYAWLVSYSPVKVPLWSSKSGLSSRTRKETQQVIVRALPRGGLVICMLILCCLPLYRAPKMLKKLWRQWYNRQEIIFTTAKAYGNDLLTVMQILLVLICLYRAPMLLSDLFCDIFQKRSWLAVRTSVKRYPLLIAEDLGNLVVVLFSWRTPRYIFTCVLFAIFMPADLFVSTSKSIFNSKLLAYSLTILLYMMFLGYPIVHGLYTGGKLLETGHGWVNMVVLVGFIAVLFILLSVVVTDFYKRRRAGSLVMPQQFDYIHFNWFNLHVMIFEVVEFLQLFALAFVFDNIPMYGHSVLHSASDYLLVSFVSFDIKFGVGVFLFVVWFLISSAPVILEQILDEIPKNTCASNGGWQLSMSLFTNTLFITMMECLLSSLSCRYTLCSSPVSLLPANASCLHASVYEDASSSCWSGSHKGMAIFGLIALVWYSVTSLIFAAEHTDLRVSVLDLKFSPIYNSICNFIKAVMVTAVTIVTMRPIPVMGILLAGNAAMIVLTMAFIPLFGHPPCNFRVMVVCRLASFSAAAVASLAVITAFASDVTGNRTPLYMVACGCALVVLVAIVISIVITHKSATMKDRNEFCAKILELEKRLFEKGELLSQWRGQRSAWLRLVNSVHGAHNDDRYFDETALYKLRFRANEAVLSTSTILSDEDKRGYLLPLASDHAVANDDINDCLPPPPNYAAAVSADPTSTSNPSTSEPTGGVPFDGNVSKHSPDSGIVEERDDTDDCKIDRTIVPIPRTADVPLNDAVFYLPRYGTTILLALEHHIAYKSYSFTFMTQRGTWLGIAMQSNWRGLLECVDVLQSHLTKTFDMPDRHDLSFHCTASADDSLPENPMKNETPPCYVFEAFDAVSLAAKSRELRQQALEDVSRFHEHGEHWQQLLSKILPDIPVIKAFEFTMLERGSATFELHLRRPASGTIKHVGPRGYKLAQGACVKFGKTTKGSILDSSIVFNESFRPKARKGPVTVTINEISLVHKKNTIYVEVEGRAVRYDKVMDSLHEISWK